MDIFYAYVLSLFVAVVSFLIHFMLYKPVPVVNGKLPPGQRGWPVIGESVEFLANGWKGHPEKFFFDRMNKFSPHVFRTSLMREDAAVFCGPAGNKFLFSNENKLVQGWLSDSVHKIFPTLMKKPNTELTKLRKMLHSVLKAEVLIPYVPIMDMVTQKHFETEWEVKDQIGTHEVTTNYSFSLACKIFLSMDEPKDVKYLSGPFMKIAPGIFSIPIDLPGTPLRRGINAANFLRKEILVIVQQRKIDLAEGKASPTQDILSHMLIYNNEHDKSITEIDTAAMILGLLSGGHDNLTSTCTCIVKYLAELPAIYEGVHKEQMEIAKSKASGELLKWGDVSKMKYSWNVACEALRLAPPLQGSFREAITDFTYKDYFIPKGWKLYWSTNSTHKNPELFPEPEKFDPSRFGGKGPAPYTYVPFGGGPHLCAGKEYSRLQILVFMHHLVTKFKWEKVIPDEQIVLNPMPNPAKGLPIRLYQHKSG